MPADNSWTMHATEIAYAGPRLQVRHDEVTRPDGRNDTYDWVEAAHQVRVAAIVDDTLLLIEQSHYLIGRSIQLPGGNVDPPDSPLAAAKGELQQETGFMQGDWQSYGRLYPLPGLTTVAVHLWVARDLEAGDAAPEPAERDIRVLAMPMRGAYEAVLDGRVTCAASATLILRLYVAACAQRVPEEHK